MKIKPRHYAFVTVTIAGFLSVLPVALMVVFQKLQAEATIDVTETASTA